MFAEIVTSKVSLWFGFQFCPLADEEYLSVPHSARHLITAIFQFSHFVIEQVNLRPEFVTL